MSTQAITVTAEQAADISATHNAAQVADQLAGQVAEQALAVPAFSWSGYLLSLGMLCMILGGLWLAMRFLKNKGGLKFFGINETLVLESRLSIGPKKNLLIVRIPGKKLVLGVTDHHISKLAELPLDSEDEDFSSGNKELLPKLLDKTKVMQPMPFETAPDDIPDKFKNVLAKAKKTEERSC